MKPSLLIIVLILFLLLLISPATGSSELEHQRFLQRVSVWESILRDLEYVPDEIIVEFSDTRSLSTVEAGVLTGFSISEVFGHRSVAVFRIDGSESLPEALARLENTPGIKSVSPNLIRHCSFVPNDSLYNRQEYMIPIRSESAWDVTTGSAAVNVAIIDTGIDINHPEFSGRIIWKENFRDPGSTSKDNVFDDSGHGTAVAGVLAAMGNNGIGIAGMAWDVRLMVFRACGGDALSCTLSNEVQAIDAAVARGAHVINLSLGGKGTASIEIDAIKKAYDAGVVIVAAAGNDSPGVLYESSGNLQQDYLNLYYPAAFPEVIGVAALDNKNGSITNRKVLTRAEFSNYGEDIVSVAAVGTAVMTTVPYMPVNEVPYAFYSVPNYTRVSGTSFASPQVAGTAALILSLFPQLSPKQVRNLIESTAFALPGPDTDKNNINDYLGYGVLDAGAAVEAGSGTSPVYQNSDFRAGVFKSPLFYDDIMVYVVCLNGSDVAPEVTYFVEASAKNGSVAMDQLPSQPNKWLGLFRIEDTGAITITVRGALNGYPLDMLSFVYTAK